MKKKLFLITAAALCALAAAGFPSRAHEGEHHSPGGNGQPNDEPLVAQSFTPCVDGMAGTFPCNNVDLASLMPLADIDGTPTNDTTSNDVWGWTDHQTGKEYALLGLSNGVAFVDITDPSNPVHLGNLPTHTVNSLWRGVKVYRDHAFIVSEAANHGLQIFDLRQLRGRTAPAVAFTETAYYDGFASAHTIAVNEETGFVYAAGSRPNPNKTVGVDTCGARGLHMVDVKNPSAPAFAGCVDADGYTHETQCVIYRGPDAAHRDREICFSANEDTLTIVDVTNKANPAQLSRTTYTGRGYTHQGWLTDDHKTFLVNDELDEQNQHVNTRTFVWDVTNLDAPFVRNVQTLSTTAIDHNLYVRGRFVFESNYRSGVRVLDTENVAAGNLNEVAFFDVYPTDDQPLFNGTWANYPFFASGTVIASGMEQGLFVLKPRVGLPVYIDYTPFFVRQHYRDFLNREPDEAGLAFWSHEIAACTTDPQCLEVKRINVSAAFFLSIEFRETGFFVYRLQKSSFGSMPTFAPFLADTREIGEDVVVGRPGWEAQLEANKRAFVEAWVQRPEFVAEFPSGMSAADYVSKLFQRAGVAPTAAESQAAASEYGAGDVAGRARALRSVAESQSVFQGEFNRAFVFMQYVGYLRRDPDEGGFNFWLSKLEEFNGNFVNAEMVKAFITSIEYRQRFGQ